jgi:hypothetical protein
VRGTKILVRIRVAKETKIQQSRRSLAIQRPSRQVIVEGIASVQRIKVKDSRQGMRRKITSTPIRRRGAKLDLGITSSYSISKRLTSGSTSTDTKRARRSGDRGRGGGRRKNGA